jgi:hypothetical protein
LFFLSTNSVCGAMPIIIIQMVCCVFSMDVCMCMIMTS